ncbi:SDR family oxidoreductase [Chryseosolibacter indicus]|uniref:SDR family oxidoreductase n=1 Tax=Chryseosolibacter indicus TaxID=2782351 RepID=A0ABS5VV08_9BACT|nr:SDR family oxidoreductase [Chryseosolibacter indicus]MBT1705267.1 SDR family oxidoreductase [Chryseosolibacter indicus]
MILVTGANGHLGSAIINSLLKKGVSANNIIGLVREEAKAQDLKAKGIELRVGDYDWYTTLVKAFQGVEKLILVSGRDLTTRVEQHNNVITAAKEVGVKHLLYTSFFEGNDSRNSPFDFVSSSLKATDAAIKESGIAYTLFKNNLYTELLPIMFGQNVLKGGIYLPAGEGKAAYITRPDIAEAIAQVATQEGHLNKQYNISNTENVSLAEVAAILSEMEGTEIKYASPSKADYITTMEKNGLSLQPVKIFAGLSEAIKSGEFQSITTDLEMLLGRKPTTMKQFLKQTYFKTATII